MTKYARRRIIPTESQEQSVVIQWWASYAATKGIDERLLFAIPNGAHKSIAQAMKFKREGLRKGAPDLMLAMSRVMKNPQGTAMVLFHGLFIEMKRKGEKASEEQIEFASLLRKAGYNALICIGAEEAMRAIRAYVES